MCKCKDCANYKPNNAWTAKAQAFAMRGENAENLTVVPQPTRPITLQPTTIYPGAYIQTPVAQQNIESNVKVPLAQSLITGAICGAASACVVFYAGLPKPLLITFGATIVGVYRTWTGGINLADSLLTKVEDYTGIDVNRDGQVGSEPAQLKPRPELRLVRQSGYGSDGNTRVYEPDPQEQILNIPHMPQDDTNPWTVTRMVDFLESAFVADTWARAHCRKHHEISQGQWGALRAHVRFFEEDEKGKKIITIWGTTDRPTLDGFIEQISRPVTHPTG